MRLKGDKLMSNIVKLKRLPLDNAKWMEFVKVMHAATIFHHPAWIDFLCECYDFHPLVIAIEDNKGRITAGIPLVETNSLFRGKKWLSLPFTDHCAPLFQDENALSLLLSGIIDQYREKICRSVELRWGDPINSQMALKSDYVLSKIKLGPDPEVVASRIKPKHFRQIQVSQNRGIHVKVGTDADQMQDFYSLHLINRHRLGVPIQPRKFFKLMYERLLQQGYGFVISAYKDNKCVAAALFLHWNKNLIYKYAASNEVGRQQSAMDPILWTAINWGCEHGKETLDLGRSLKIQEGLRKFKKRWGADESPLTYSLIPDRSSSKMNDLLLGLLKITIRHSPLWVCRLSGELLYKYSV